ncbi:hypothetical protein ANN_19701 [Periplaneta americana]|uniref:Uncharacterized protein n=1 Tax=Periplaneta americana TaxID=6978 RepID=A0ABQ8SBR0_PERAM|nr:hypothetical protein ANN_19701 [Periplaneta americana]
MKSVINKLAYLATADLDGIGNSSTNFGYQPDRRKTHRYTVHTFDLLAYVFGIVTSFECVSENHLSDLSRVVASWSKASCLGLALWNVRWFESSWGKKFSHEISASVWDRCPPSIVMHLGSYEIRLRKPAITAGGLIVLTTRYLHSGCMIRSPLLRHVAVRPAVGWSVLALRGL